MKRLITSIIISILITFQNLPVSMAALNLKPYEFNNFTTDGCSMFPDSGFINDWRHCCIVHDIAYWVGGTEDERLAADTQLAECVNVAVGENALSIYSLGWVMHLGVRVGGAPMCTPVGGGNPFPWRWGYGWSENKCYAELTAFERLTAKQEIRNLKIQFNEYIRSGYFWDRTLFSSEQHILQIKRAIESSYKKYSN